MEHGKQMTQDALVWSQDPVHSTQQYTAMQSIRWDKTALGWGTRLKGRACESYEHSIWRFSLPWR